MAKAGEQDVAEVPYELKLNQDSKVQSHKNQPSRLNLNPAPITTSIEMVINVKGRINIFSTLEFRCKSGKINGIGLWNAVIVVVITPIHHSFEQAEDPIISKVLAVNSGKLPTACWVG